MFDCVMPILLKSWKTIAKTGMKATTAIKLHWAIPEKQTNRGAGGWGGVENREFPISWAGVLKKEHTEIPGLN